MTITQGIEVWIENLIDNTNFTFRMHIDGTETILPLVAYYGQNNIMFTPFEHSIGIGEELSYISLDWENVSSTNSGYIAGDNQLIPGGNIDNGKVFTYGGKLRVNSLSVSFTEVL